MLIKDEFDKLVSNVKDYVFKNKSSSLLFINDVLVSIHFNTKGSISVLSSDKEIKYYIQRLLL